MVEPESQAAKMVETESKRKPCQGAEVRFMRYGKYEPSERGGTTGTAITFLMMGLGAGALIALLFTPKSGKQMRRDLRRKYEDARETFDEWKEEAKEVAEEAIERGAEIADEVRERVTPLTKVVRRG